MRRQKAMRAEGGRVSPATNSIIISEIGNLCRNLVHNSKPRAFNSIWSFSDALANTESIFFDFHNWFWECNIQFWIIANTIHCLKEKRGFLNVPKMPHFVFVNFQFSRQFFLHMNPSNFFVICWQFWFVFFSLRL